MDKDISKKDTSLSLEELFSLSPVSHKPVGLSFTAPDLSSQGGLLLIANMNNNKALYALSVPIYYKKIRDAPIWFVISMKRC